MDQIVIGVVNWGGWPYVGALVKWGVWPTIVAGLVSWKTANKTIDAQRERLRREFQLEFAIEAAIQTLLSSEAYKMRSFDRIKHHLAGFPGDELRRYLIRAGAVRFSGEDDQEMWGLVSRHRGELFK